MRRELAQAPFQYLRHRMQSARWQFIMLDSYDPGHVGGRLTRGELARLDAALAGSPAHAMVCLHHHPVADGQPLARQRRARQCRGLLARHRRAPSRARRRLGPCASGLRRHTRRGAPVRHALDRRAIPAAQRSLRHRLAPAGLSLASTCTPTGASRPRSTGSNRSMRRAAARDQQRTDRATPPAPCAFLGAGARAASRSSLAAARADGALHSLWELHGKHNTVYLLGSIHVLRPSDYPLAPGGARRLQQARNR